MTHDSLATYHDVSSSFASACFHWNGSSRLLVYSCIMYSTGPGIVNALFSQLILFLMTQLTRTLQVAQL